MAGPKLHSFKDVKSLAKELRHYVITAQDEAIKRHGRFLIALSGGSLPKILAEALFDPPTAVADGGSADGGADTAPSTPPAVRFDKWEIFFADERAVPLRHADSNYKLVRDELLKRIPVGRESGLGHGPTVHAIDAVASAEAANVTELAASYDRRLCDVFARRSNSASGAATKTITTNTDSKTANATDAAGSTAADSRLPVFDLILLGCGPDGHTCSLFPGHASLQRATEGAWVLPITDSPKPPPQRITFSLGVAANGARIGFVATGAGKKEVLKQIFDDADGEGGKLPCGRVNGIAGGRVTWFTDKAAVEGVLYPRA